MVLLECNVYDSFARDLKKKIYYKMESLYFDAKGFNWFKGILQN